MTPATADVLTTPAPAATSAEAQAIASRHFGVHGEASPLPAERDRNFRLVSEAGNEYLLKLINPAEDPDVTRFQTGALRHLEAADPGLPVPRIVKALTGEDVAAVGADGLRARLTTYVPGTPMLQARTSADLRSRLGALLARLDQALAGYAWEGHAGVLLWDLSKAAQLRPLTGHIEDGARRALVERVLDRFDAQTGPSLSALPRQAIHNDFNPSNVLVDDQGTPCGVIDFGDVVLAPRIQDVAVAAAYHVAASGDVLAPVLDVVRGYHAIAPLAPAEAEILFDLIELRMAMTATISSWRASLDTSNRDYIMRHAARAWSGVMRAGALDPARAREAIRRRLRKAGP